jgi:hypothetical protein
VPHLLRVGPRRQAMPSWAEMLRNGTIGGEELLGLSCRLEPLHAPLPLAGGLVRILGAVVQIAVLAMVYTGYNLAPGGTVALELVRDDHPGNILAAPEQLAEEFLCRVLVPPTLDQDIQDITVLIPCPLQIVAGATDRQKDLIRVPLIPRLRPSVAQLIGIRLAKLTEPFPDRFIGHDDATGK